MPQHLFIQMTLYHMSSGHLQEVDNKRKFQTVSSESGRGPLPEVVVIGGSTVTANDPTFPASFCCLE